MNSLSLLRSIEWSEIWERWEEMERGQWDDYLRQKGFDDWRSWRGEYAEKIKLKERKWGLYSVNDPFKDIPKMIVGAFPSWKMYYSGIGNATFFNLAIHPDLKKNNRISEIGNNPPQEIFLIGLIYGEYVLVFEGTHRCFAITLASMKERFFPCNVSIALSDIEEFEVKKWEKEYPELYKVYTKGTLLD